MKNFKHSMYSVLFLLMTTVMFSQGKIKGTVVDNELGGSLPGVNVKIKGTTSGTSTDIDGKFQLNSTTNSGQVVITFIGYKSITVDYAVSNGQTVDLGTIKLSSDSSEIEEVVIIGKGVIDLAKDRKTPIAVSSIKANEIQAKIGTADITQTMVNTPSVYVSGQAGGFGDSRISVRGFQQDNTAFLLNGQPINGMEDGKMYWSNWSGMADIANAIQIQRGLGSSKLAISSVGGTVNFVTKATELKEGGFMSMGVANDDYFKSTVAYNTGMSKKGWGASFMISHWQGDGYNEGTRGEGQNYFLSVGYKASDKHSFNFLVTGAPQSHDQNFTKRISDYLGFGRKYNNNYGYLNGKYISERTNFYHKPVANFNWDYKINSKMDLSTVLYASWGRGGGTGNYGSGKKSISELNPYTGTNQNTYIDFNQIYANNSADADGIGSSANYAIRASMNNHAWYGVVSNLKTKLNEDLSLNLGLDLRTYHGDHYRQITNFLGLNGWTESRFLRDNNHVIPSPNTLPSATNTVTESYNIDPWHAFFNKAADNQKIDYDYSETITYGGVFGQLEYSKDNLSAFFQGSVSNQSHQRFDYYDYQEDFQDSEKVTNLGYNAKAGGSYKFGVNHSVYVNAGFYNRQPYHDNIYLNFTNEVNESTSNEKILGLEAGYNFKSKRFNASINAYRTTWEDRVVSTSRVITALTETIGTTTLVQGDLVYTSNLGVKQQHTGLELDFTYNPINKFDVRGFASVGNWEYKDDAVSRRFDESNNLLDETRTDVDGGKVGDGAQTTWGLGAKYEIVKGLSIDADWRNYDKLYANSGAIKDNLELPSYDLVDAGITYKMLVGKDNKNSVVFRINMNNVFDEVYLSEITGTPIKSSAFLSGTSGPTYQSAGRVYKGIADGNQGYFGFGRTWNVSLRYNF
ncbi:carboxypeptidase-like regulatory domain-containing protein [Flavobacterium sp.]|uniref:TonB-dependent receptor n=1 Tax=Flavobacterium sp. TaxID=239 RepID=UPI00262E18B6|nr:carboxypeptidase-like regulatory domain-containing protein [Flavobacterium sp.]